MATATTGNAEGTFVSLRTGIERDGHHAARRELAARTSPEPRTADGESRPHRGSVCGRTAVERHSEHQPVVAKKGCLKCHGKQEDAFMGRVKRYPGTGGYNYAENDIVATFIAYVPIQKAMENLKATAFKTTLASVFSILLIMTPLN